MNKENDFYKDMIKTAPMAYALHKLELDESGQPADYVFLDMNKAFEQMTGLSHEQDINRRVSEAIPGIKEGKFDWIAYYGELTLTNTESTFVEYSDPLQRWYRVFAYTPQSMHFITLFIDISHEIENQEKLHRLKQQLASVADTQKELICRFTPDTTLTFVNDAYCKAFGKTRDELLGNSFLELIPEKERQEVLNKISALKKHKKPNTYEHRVITANDEIGWQECTDYPVLDSNGVLSEIQSVGYDITKRRAAEEKMQRSEKRFRSLFDQYNMILETTQDAIFLVEVTSGGGFRFIRNNRTHQKETGFSDDLFAGKTPEELVGKELGATISSNYQRCVNKKETISYEETPALSGQARTYSTLLSPVLEKGKVKYIVGSSRDITENKRTEQQLNKKDALQSLLITLATELINIPLEEVDRQINRMLHKIGEFTGLDRVYVFIHNYDKEITRNTHEWCAEGIKPEIENLRATPFSFFTDWHEKHSRGEDIYIPRVSDMPREHPMRAVLESQNIKSLLLLPLLYQKNNIGFVGFDSVRHERMFEKDEINLLKVLSLMISNMEEWRKAQERLQKSQRRYKMLVENLNEVIYTLDTQAFITYISPNIEYLIGFTINEVLGKHFVDFVHPEDKNDRIAQFKKILSGISEPAEYRLLKKDGTSLWIRTNARPILEEGKLKGVQGALTDITDLKQYQKDLIKAKDKAQESDRLKSAFLANMSHEIRTPMNGILGFTELLKDHHYEDDRQREFVEIIEQSGHRMLNLINDIIDVSKIESGQMPVSMSEVNVNQEMEAVYSFFLPRCTKENKNVELQLCIPDQPKFISTDQTKLQSILSNLVSNAFKFTNAGEVSMGYVEKSGQLEFFVRDTGTGIKEEKLDSLFDRFFQADPMDASNDEGAGLGLAITKAFVALLGGQIWVKSEYGSGTVFYFSLPDTSSHVYSKS